MDYHTQPPAPPSHQWRAFWREAWRRYASMPRHMGIALIAYLFAIGGGALELQHLALTTSARTLLNTALLLITLLAWLYLAVHMARPSPQARAQAWLDNDNADALDADALDAMLDLLDDDDREE